MDIVLIILLILLLCGGGFGLFNGWYGPGGPYNIVGLILAVFMFLLLFGLLSPYGHHAYW
jgi:hypothetical protein